METEHKQEFATAIGAMAETFGVEATKPLIYGYWLGLCDLDLIDVQKAVQRAIQQCKAIPKPAELRLMTGKVYDSETTALMAWEDALKALRWGKYKHVDFGDKLVNAVIRNMGGWPGFCSRFIDATSEKWIRQEFITAYKRFASSSVRSEQIAPLPGLSEVEVINGEMQTCEPVLIACDNTRKRLPCPVVESVKLTRGIEFKRLNEESTAVAANRLTQVLRDDD